MVTIGPWELTKPALRSAGGVVASQSRRAARAGAAILAAGGNAVDAAIATGMALAAAEPWMSGLGGGGYMVVQPADGGAASVIDFGMMAPQALDPGRYGLAPGGASDDALFGWPRVVEDRNVIGPDSIAVPGHIDGMRLAREKFGRLPWAELLVPAIALAEEGILLDWFGALSIAAAAQDLRRFGPSRRQYLPDGMPPMPDGEGRTRYLPLGELAKTLKHLAAAGPRDFYEGEIARSLVGELRAAGSVIGLSDLAGYQATLAPALEFDYRGARIATSADLSAGPTLKRVMGELGRRTIGGKAPGDADYLAYAAALRLAYDERLARDGAAGDGLAQRASCTSHLSVVDREGMMVSLTQTLLSRFGAKVLLPSTGIMMNNGIMWFDPRPGRPNSIAPGRRPLANMCPVIARRAERPWLALGASGGRRILPAVAQILSFTIDYGMDLQSAFHHPRLDESGRGIVTLDRRLPADLAKLMEKLGPVEMGKSDVFPLLFACASAVMREGAVNIGMGEVTSPWAGAVAERDSTSTA
jgi:gamma-glutamyltranspeptidase/glutathione hydrolase